MVPSTGEHFHDKSCQSSIIISQSLAKTIPNTILLPTENLAYNTHQDVITKDDGWKILKHIFYRWAPHIGGKAEDMQKQIYDLQVISTEDLAYFYQ